MWDISYAESITIETIYEQSTLNVTMRIPQTNRYHFPLTFERAHDSMILKKKDNTVQHKEYSQYFIITINGA